MSGMGFSMPLFMCRLVQRKVLLRGVNLFLLAGVYYSEGGEAVD